MCGCIVREVEEDQERVVKGSLDDGVTWPMHHIFMRAFVCAQESFGMERLDGPTEGEG